MATMKAIGTISDGEWECSIVRLPTGEYAVSMHHLDTGESYCPVEAETGDPRLFVTKREAVEYIDAQLAAGRDS